MDPSHLLSALGRGRDAVFGRRSYSAMSPITWMCGTAGLTCVVGGGASLNGSPGLQAVVVGFGLLFLAVGVGVGVYFAVWHPDRLQSEDLAVRTHALNIVERKGGRLRTSGEDLAAITNPYHGSAPKALPARGGSEGGRDRG